MKLRIGKIPYANLFPIFYTLEKECDCSLYEFIEGVPSVVNSMLRNGELDISPSSSIEYLKNSTLYQIINGHSISSKGHVGSILLFSKRPIEELDGSTVYVSSQSETSVALLNVIFRKFYGIYCRLQTSQIPENSGGEAFLLIGDDAFKYSSRFTVHGSQLTYDLGEIWHKNTGLPFVFALWIARKDISDKQQLLDRFVKDLDKAKEIALKNLHEIAKHSSMKAYMSEKEIVFYWKMIGYELTEDNKKGLDLFKMYLRELSFL